MLVGKNQILKELRSQLRAYSLRRYIGWSVTHGPSLTSIRVNELDGLGLDTRSRWLFRWLGDRKVAKSASREAKPMGDGLREGSGRNRL